VPHFTDDLNATRRPINARAETAAAAAVFQGALASRGEFLLALKQS
jgi:putative SOS response-associated peptidase YedK